VPTSQLPAFPAGQIQSDYTQTNTVALDYIKNKPTKFDKVDQSLITFDKTFVVTGIRYPDFADTSLTNAQKGFVKVTLYTNKASTA
jgi:hypothetical protein